MHTNQLLTGKVASSLIKFTIPIIFALLLQITYGAVDMFIVGNFSSLENLSGVSTGSQVINTLTALCIGFSMGATILLGQKIGEKRIEEIEGIISNSITFFFGVSMIIMAAMLILHDELLAAMNTPADAWQETSNYILYSSIGIPLIFSYNVLGSIFRGLGDAKTPLMAVGIACVVNVIADIVLVVVLDMGSSGAAIATVVAQGVSVVASWYIVKRRPDFNYNIWRNIFNINKEHIKRIITLGFPVALNTGLTSLSFLFITMIVNKQGVLFSAAVGVTEKLIGIVMLVPLCFMQSISVFVAQNYGAQNYTRAKQGFGVGLAISFGFGAATACYSFFWGANLIGVFNQDSEVIATAVPYLQIYSLDVLLVPFLFCLIGFLNGCGKTMYVMIQGVIGAVLIRIGLTYILSTIEPVTLVRIGMATPIATAIQSILCAIFYIGIKRKFDRQPK